MLTLVHYPLCPFSRSVRIALAEVGIEAALVEEHPYSSDREFLELNPAGTLPVLITDDGQVICGTYAISEYLSESPILRRQETGRVKIFPGSAQIRAEVRRLVDWFHTKFYCDVSQHVFEEKLYRHQTHADGEPDIDILRTANDNIRYHLRYIGYLAEQRNWLAAAELSFADMAAAAHLSCMDYLGDVPWEESKQARNWYARIKSRPSFRALLSDRIPGLTPSRDYANLDF